MKHLTISSILHHAADEALDMDVIQRHSGILYSCTAIRAILSDDKENIMWNKIMLFLQDLGLPQGLHDSFPEFHEGFEKQQARYNWLKFAALIAEEELI